MAARGHGVAKPQRLRNGCRLERRENAYLGLYLAVARLWLNYEVAKMKVSANDLSKPKKKSMKGERRKIMAACAARKARNAAKWRLRRRTSARRREEKL